MKHAHKRLINDSAEIYGALKERLGMGVDASALTNLTATILGLAADDPDPKPKLSAALLGKNETPAADHTAVDLYWSMADTMDIYLNGEPIRHHIPDFEHRPDEAPRSFRRRLQLKDRDVFTVGGRRGGSWGGIMAAVDDSNRLIWQTDTEHWQIYEPLGEPWYSPEAVEWTHGDLHVQNDPWPPQKAIIDKFGRRITSIWGHPNQHLVYMVGVVRLS
jgi:hypothetical protein